MLSDTDENNVKFEVWHPTKDDMIPDKDWAYDLIRLVDGKKDSLYVVEYAARAYEMIYERTNELNILLKNISDVFNN